MDKVARRSVPIDHSPHAHDHRNSIVSLRHRDLRVTSMQQSSCAPLRRRRASLLRLHHRHRTRTHHLWSPPYCLCHIIGLGGTSLGVWWGAVGLGGLGREVGRAVGRVGTAHREVFSVMHGTFGEPTLLHCPCLTSPSAVTVLDDPHVHWRGLPRGELVAGPPFRIDVKRRAPTCHALGKLLLRGHSVASRHGIETG